MHSNRPTILNTPDQNKAYLFFNPISVRKCTNKISIMDPHKNYSLLAHQFVSLPTTSPQQHQHPLSIRKPTSVPTPRPSVNTLGSTLHVPSTPTQQKYLQELLSTFYNLGKSQHINYCSPQVTTTQKGVESFIPQT